MRLKYLTVKMIKKTFLILHSSFLIIAGCQPHDAATDAPPPPVGHYQGTVQPAAGPPLAAALDIRHPSAGHYEAELTLPDAPGLCFVADTVRFAGQKLRLVRPGIPAQVLDLTLDGDFWRGNLTTDTVRAAVLLVRRGGATPSTYRVEELPQGGSSAWLFAPADTATPGPALALLPDATTAAAAPLWADALARNGFVVLLLPAADSSVSALPAALRLLRNTAGTDTATVGAWLAGGRALALARSSLAGPQPAFLVLQNPPAAGRGAWQAVVQSPRPLLGLAAGRAGSRALRLALPRRRGSTLLALPAAAVDLQVPGPLGPALDPAVVADVVTWLRGR